MVLPLIPTAGMSWAPEKPGRPRFSCRILCMVKITVRPKSSLRVEFAPGELELIGEDGQPIDLTGKPAISLCRCGGSTNKPFCDGTHSRIGFMAAEEAVAQAQTQELPGQDLPK